VADIKRGYTLFVDEARTVQFLSEYQKEFLYNEEPEDEEEEEEEEEATAAAAETTDKMETS
jgi:RuvB-like protein 2